jgi:hypothetical protein
MPDSEPRRLSAHIITTLGPELDIPIHLDAESVEDDDIPLAVVILDDDGSEALSVTEITILGSKDVDKIVGKPIGLPFGVTILSEKEEVLKSESDLSGINSDLELGDGKPSEPSQNQWQRFKKWYGLNYSQDADYDLVLPGE